MKDRRAHSALLPRSLESQGREELDGEVMGCLRDWDIHLDWLDLLSNS